MTIDPAAYKIPTIEKLIALHNNYIVMSNQNEVYTAQERIEENNFLDAILSTSVMQHTRNFLISKGNTCLILLRWCILVFHIVIAVIFSYVCVLL